MVRSSRQQQKVNRRVESAAQACASEMAPLLGSLAAGIRKRLYDDLKRPHDLFRAWDRDEDGRVSVAELLAGCAHLGLAVSPTDEPAVERALVVQTY